MTEVTPAAPVKDLGDLSRWAVTDRLKYIIEKGAGTEAKEGDNSKSVGAGAPSVCDFAQICARSVRARGFLLTPGHLDSQIMLEGQSLTPHLHQRQISDAEMANLTLRWNVPSDAVCFQWTGTDGRASWPLVR